MMIHKWNIIVRCHLDSGHAQLYAFLLNVEVRKIVQLAFVNMKNMVFPRIKFIDHYHSLFFFSFPFLVLQEVGNVPYVVENGCGKFSKSPKEIANIVAQWFGPKADELQAMSQNCLKLARPDAVFKIVNDLHELVRHRNFVPQYSCAT